MSDIAFDAAELVKWIYITTPKTGYIRIECNRCSEKDFLFFEGTERGGMVAGVKYAAQTDWLAQAAVHVAAHRKEGEVCPV